MSTTTARTRDGSGRFTPATDEQGNGAERTALEQATEQVERIRAARAEAQRIGDEARAKVERIDADRAAGALSTDYLGRVEAVAHAADADEQVVYLDRLLVVAEQTEASYRLEDDALALVEKREDITAAHHEAVAKVRAALAEYIAVITEWNADVRRVAGDARAAGLDAEHADPTLPVRAKDRGTVLVGGHEFTVYSTGTDAIIREARA